MLTRRIMLIAVAVGCWLASCAATFDELRVKADRFIGYGEWPSAMAMLQLMADMRPEDSDVTGQAIAVAGLLDNEAEQLRLFRSGVDHRQRFDSVFSAVEAESFALGRGSIYEKFLLMIAREEPWTARTIDAYMLKYYTFRRDGEGMVKYASKMLNGLPESVDFLRALGSGYLLLGQYEDAGRAYDRILEVSPDDVDALLTLGFYRESQGDYAKACEYLDRAYGVAPTPYLASKIKGIKDVLNPL